MAPSLAAVSEAIPGSSEIRLEGANILLVLLSFLMTSEIIPLDLLVRGATPRRRWNAQGKIDEVDAICAGLVPELSSLLSDMPRLSNAFHELGLSSAVSKNSSQAYTVDEAVAARVRESLSPELHSFWRCQALVVAYRSISWKYIEPAARADLVLTLIEASRFPNMAWKRFAVGRAEVAARGLEDWYLHSCIAHQGKLPSTTDKRMRWTIGQITIQRSLNCIQVEDLSAAKELLESWSPFDQSTPPMEEVMLFRKDMVLGRVLRFQGEFIDSLTHLERSRKTAAEHKDLIFDKDLRDLTCDLADTLRELGDLASAEHHLRVEIARRDQHCISSPGRSLLELSLAEALFAQGRFKETEKLCLDIQSRTGLLKFEKLRLHITLAKIRHIDSDDNGASSYWAKAMVAISQFPNESGATRIIVMSVCDILSRQSASWPENWLLNQSLETLDSLGKLAKPGGVRCWIAGLRHWVEYLQSRGNLRSHL
ncbi:hypothetical protein B0T17DRAFT_588740 [Bombardia bombarda]|uniref:Uncharacterized protein n=1 Tax=Bombardia bombarda TaxID=252184 RepID=A0AA39X7S7_9PEZI|nr:hypothetical protein B0T17DRAFT_588740 [Bombardia bombarda]